MEYKKHFLTRVIFQANYTIDALKTTVDDSLSKICADLTGAEKKADNNINFNVIVTSAKGNVETTNTFRWTFIGSELQVVIQHDSIHITSLKYTTHESFHSTVNEIISKLKEVYNPVFSRVALRYINQIIFTEGSTYDFDGLINPSLLNATQEYKAFGLTRSMGNMTILDEEENVTTNFVYGFYNSQFPGKIIKREFVLDFDAFLVNPTQIDTIKPILMKLRNKVNSLFEKSILDGLREKMK